MNLNTITSSIQFYNWNNYRCAYEFYQPNNQPNASNSYLTPIVLIHPIGVGLSRKFWHRFCQEWYQQDKPNQIYNPDLLGCGESDKPRVAYYPEDWAEQLQCFLHKVVKKPAILIVQGALFPVAIELAQKYSNLIHGLVLACPPNWKVMTQETSNQQQKIIWNLLNSPLGGAFYRYARREKFLQNFSVKQLFGSADAVDAEWLNTLRAGSKNPATRHAVFSFLAGFWRKDYLDGISSIKQPTLVVVGQEISSISKEGKTVQADEWLAQYLAVLPQGTGIKLPGRNVLPYESTTEFVKGISPFIEKFSDGYSQSDKD
ncbi:alpha/beta hydrolase [Mastigocoleus sp. MO_188.B34]|uniref:alpha/beta fold hydrolase n=1 Tax=Mastigocoleus sp. MO_188.B34 TaxID=3036635 RepID=UPI00261CF3F6|nr:alpha/beta hydrolase [Mastigocoleus sp. MO_188.B34]MDJ0697173.1 alpha/beta hydrolase [Mastigocoleus sp. MO_188.B34]